MAQEPSASAPSRPLPRRGLERLDLMLLCMEALDFNGGEAMVWMSENMGFAKLFPNRVELWKRRCYNPLRRTCRRGALESHETDALIRILCEMADRLYPMLRALLSGAEKAEVRQQRWELFQDRLAQLMRERMNPRRSGVQAIAGSGAGGRPSPQAGAGSGPGGWRRWFRSPQGQPDGSGELMLWCRVPYR